MAKSSGRATGFTIEQHGEFAAELRAFRGRLAEVVTSYPKGSAPGRQARASLAAVDALRAAMDGHVSELMPDASSVEAGSVYYRPPDPA